MTCTRCEGTGFLNLNQVPDGLFDRVGIEGVIEWMKANMSDVQVCDCCGDGQNWYGIPGSHDSKDNGSCGPYAYNGGLPECN